MNLNKLNLLAAIYKQAAIKLAISALPEKYVVFYKEDDEEKMSLIDIPQGEDADDYVDRMYPEVIDVLPVSAVDPAFLTPEIKAEMEKELEGVSFEEKERTPISFQELLSGG